jgi:twinkle protein
MSLAWGIAGAASAAWPPSAVTGSDAVLSARHLDLLEKRGLDPETLVRFGVESVNRSDGDWISIPFRLNGEVVNHKFRTIAGQKRFYQDEGAPKTFWNIDVLSDTSLSDLPVIITEGELDAIAAIQCGFPRTMSVPDGAPAEAVGDNPESQKYTFVRNALKQLQGVKEIILATDTDGPGVNLMSDLAIRLGKGRCKFVRYPKGCKDLNDALMQYGPRGVTESLNRAQWMRVDGIYRLPELPPVEPRRIYSLGMPVVEHHFNVRPQDFIVVTGIPSHGKSTWLDEVGCRMVRHHGWTVAYASFERETQTDHRRYLRTWFHGKREKYQTAEEKAEADSWITQHFSFICPSDDDEVTLDWTLDKAQASVVQHDARMVFIDPWNEMDHVRPRDMTLTEYTGFAIKEFKRFARRHNVPVCVAAHPMKQQKDKDGNFQIPTLYDISDSAHWYNKCDAGLVVWRGKVRSADTTILRVAKSRYHDQIGRPGDVELRFDPDSNHFEPIDTSFARLDE